MLTSLLRLASRLAAIVAHDRHARELDAELETHKAMLAEEYRRRGMSVADADRAARLRVGGTPQLHDAHRDVRGVPLIEDLARDVRQALRSWWTQPGFAATVIVTLAIGIGANTAIFTVIRALLLTPRPYANADRILTLNETWPEFPGGRPVSLPNYRDWAQQSTVFEQTAAVSWGSVTVNEGPSTSLGTGSPTPLAANPPTSLGPVYVNGSTVSPSYFDVFGLRAALGRTFAPDEDQPGRDRVVVLSHRLWSSRFSADPTIVGRSIRLDGEPHVVIGVMPPRTNIEFLDIQLWRPLTFDVPPARGSRVLRQAVARLKPGATVADAQTEMTVLAHRLAREYPESNKGFGVLVRPISRPLGLDVEPSLYLLFAAVGAVLLIACVNLATLALARGAARTRDVAIRTAIGASRARLVRQFLAEHALLGMGGGLCGALLAHALVASMIRLVPSTGLRAAFPPDTAIAMGSAEWVFAIVISIASGIGFGVAPAMAATARSILAAIRDGGAAGVGVAPRYAQLRRTLVIAQVALAVVLVTGATLLVRGFFTLTARVESGFEATHVLTAGLPMPATRFQSAAGLNAHLDDIEQRLRSEPGIRDVAFADSPPTYGAPFLTRFQRVGQTVVPFMQRPVAGFKVVSPSYFRAVGLRLLDGRALTDEDRDNAPLVAVINQAMARAHFQGTNPIGERLLMRRIPLESSTSAAGPARRPNAVVDSTWTIVGVIADEGVDPFDARVAQPAVYATREQHPRANLALVVRTRVDPNRMRETIRKAVVALDPDQALPDVKTVDQLVAEDVAPDRLRSLLLSTFAAIALALAGTGLYGLIAYAVAQRTREIGIRLALGATRRNVRALVVGELGPLVAAGLAAGLVGAAMVAQVLRTFLYGVSAADPATFAGVVALLAVVSLLACYLPARRATQIDPLDALRL